MGAGGTRRFAVVDSFATRSRYAASAAGPGLKLPRPHLLQRGSCCGSRCAASIAKVRRVRGHILTSVAEKVKGALSVWVRFFEQPWWLRWLINSTFIAALLTVYWCVEITHPWERVDPTVLALAAAGFSLAAGAVSALGQRPAHASYSEAFPGLDQAQRAEAARALRVGDVPANHSVLAGAVRAGAVAEHYYRRANQGRPALVTWVVLLVLVGVGLFFLGDPRHGTLWLLMTIIFTALDVRRKYLHAKLKTRLGQLHSAAAAAKDITTSDLTPPPPPRRNPWQIVMFVVVVGAASMGLAALTDRPRRDCRTADATVSFLADHFDMLNSQLITTGGPDLHTYQDWADQVSRFADQVSAADIAPHIRIIADRAHAAVSLVTQARTTPPPKPVIDVQIAYAQNASAIIDAEHPLTAACHPG